MRAVGTFAVVAIVAVVLACGAGCASTERVYVVNGAADGGPGGVGPSAECGPGAMKVLGESACTPIGWSECGDGFEKDPSGWGCREIVADACTGATRASLGSTTCVPIGDCNAPFPPAGATLFVSPTGPTNATHFHSVESAALVSRKGDIIAVDAGVYHESVQLDAPVTIAGRCAAQVILDGTGLTTPGLIVDVPVAVRGITLRKFPTGIQAVADLDVSDSLFEENLDAAVYAEMEVTPIVAKISRSAIRNTKPRTLVTAFGIDLAKGTTMEVVDTEISGTEGVGILAAPSSKVNVRSTIVRDTRLDREKLAGIGIHAQGGDATVRDSAIITSTDSGIKSSKSATVTVERTVVRGTRAGAQGLGHGLVAATGSTMNASKVVLTETNGVGITCVGSTATLTDAVVRAQKPAPDGDYGDGAYVFDGGSLVVTRVAMLDNFRAGADVFDEKSELTFDHVLLGGTQLLASGVMGLGVAIGFGGHGTITSSIIGNNHHTGIFTFDGATLDVTNTAIRDTTLQLGDVPLGHGIFAMNSKHVVIEGCEVRRSAGIGLAFSNSSATVSRSVVGDNTVGIHVQDGSTLQQVDVAPAQPAGNSVSVSADTVFEGNASRVGSGTVPLPTPLTPLKP
jgi:hypothetical protein